MPYPGALTPEQAWRFAFSNRERGCMNVLTIVGTQGAGMTSMAMAYARERAAQFNDREETGILHIFFDSEYPEQLLRNYHTFIVEAEDFPSWNFKQLINYLAAECSPDAVIIVCGEPRR